MKVSSIFLAACAAFGVSTVAHGQTTVLHLTGSTAYRANVNKAITDLNWAGGTFNQAYIGGAADITGSNVAIYTGTIGTTAVVIKTSFTGSEAGIEDVAGSLAVPAANAFLADNTTTASATKGTQTSNGSLSTNTFATDTSVPDVAMSDTFQSTSQYFNNTLNLSGPGPTTFATLTAANNGTDTTGIVGVVPFKFCASRGATITGVTQEQVRTIFTSNRTSQAVVDGNSAHVGSPTNGFYIYASGRDPDSGTRLSALAECGLGALSTVKQYQPSTSAGAQIATAGVGVAKAVQFPVTTVNYLSTGVTGNGGYNSGGNLAKGINNDTSTMTSTQGATTFTGGTFVAYLGTNDSDGQITGNAATGIVELSYNGVTLGKFSDYNTAAPLIYGQYSFWGYEHMYYRSATASTAIGTLADTIAQQIHDTDALVKVSSMHAARTTDGSIISAQ